MRICDLTTLYMDGAQGGVNTYLTEKARYLAEHPGVSSHAMIVPGRRNARETLFGTTVYTLKSPRLPGNPEQRVLTHFREVQRILRDEAPTVLEVDCAYFLGRVAAICDVPIIGFYHVHLPRFIARPWASRFGRVLGDVTERMAWHYVDFCRKHVDRIVVTSEDIRRRLEAAGFDDLVHVPLGVNLDLFRPATNGSEGPDEPLRILNVGRLSPEKELDLMIDAFGLLADRSPGRYELTIVGDGPSRPALERQATGISGVRFHGRCEYGEALARLYAEADLFVSPGSNETFNLTLLEALAAGLPVVSVRRGGPASLVTDEIGALAEPGSATDLADKIEQVATQRERYNGCCREHVEARYSWARTFDQLLEVYEGAINGSASPPRERCVATS